MEKTIIYNFTQEDYDLLKKKIPNNPCTKCTAYYDGSCCGCYEGRQYSRAIRPYEDKDILDFAKEIKNYHDILDNIEKSKQKLKEIKNKLPEGIVENVIESEK